MKRIALIAVAVDSGSGGGAWIMNAGTMKTHIAVPNR
jgi:hypothetical protein